MGKNTFRPLWLALACLLPYAHADANDIPLDIIQEPSGGNTYIYRLGINVGVNGGTPQEYLFDTGSDSFNIDVGNASTSPSWFPKLSSSTTSAPYLYAYGDGTYGYWQENATISSIQFYKSSTGTQVSGFSTPQGLPVAAALDWVMTSNQFAPSVPGGDTQGAPITTGTNSSNQTVTLYQDLTWQQNINQGNAPEEGHFYGTFGAGDFVYPGDNGGPPGMLTTTGYIVEANGTASAPGTCGQACFILGLTPALRAQFLTVVPWVGGAQNTFNLSGANAAQQFDTMFNYTLNGGKYTATLQTLFDSGTPTIYLNDAGLLASETNAGHVNAYGDEIPGVTLTVSGAVPGAYATSILTGNDTSGDQSNVVTPGNNGFTSPGTALYGISFFMHNAVMYDLQNEATGYTPFYVTDAAINTRFTATAAMGPLGLAGVISGSGPFTVASGGAANLSGANTYTGATIIQSGGWLGLAGPGTIATSSGVQADGNFDVSRVNGAVPITSLSGSGSVFLGGNTLVLTRADDTFGGTLSDGGLGGGGGGGLIVAGGVETLSGSNTYSGNTGVSPNAELILNGSVAGSLVDAGVLAGNGHISGNAVVAGTIAPGAGASASQTFTVAGNYAQLAGSTYAATLNSRQSSLIAVSGKADIASGAMLQIIPGSVGQLYQSGHSYDVLSAQGGLSGTFTLAGDTALSAVLQAVPFYDADHFYLDVSQMRPLTAVGGTRNEMATLTAVQALPSSSPPFQVLSSLPSDALIRTGADQLSGEVYATTQNVLLQDTRFVRDAMAARMHEADQGAPNLSTVAGQQPTNAQPNGLTWWGQFVGSWGQQDSNGNAASVSDTLGGFLVGADMPLGTASHAGLITGYTQTSLNVNQRGSNVSSDDVHLGAYAGTQLGQVELTVGTDVAQYDVDTTRSIVLPDESGHEQGRANAYTAEVFGEAAYRIALKPFELDPFVQAAYVRLNTNGVQEQGDAMALAVTGNTRAVTYTTLGTSASTHFVFNGDLFTAHASLGWQHAAGQTQPDATSAFAGGDAFDVDGLPIARNALALDTGLDLMVNKKATLSVSYDGQFASHAVQSGFKASFTWKF